MTSAKLSACMLLVAPLALAACGGAGGGDAAATLERSGAAGGTDAGSAAITFTSAWTDTASQPLVAGQPASIAYDPARLVGSCGGSVTSGGGGGGFAWAITGYAASAGGAAVSFPVAITGAWAGGNAVVTPAASGDLQLWFGCGNTSGGTGWDSNYGGNYHFTVVPSVTADAGATPDAAAVADAGNDAASSTGTVVVEVLSDAVVGNAGDLPPDTLSSTPTASALVYDGAWEAGNPLGQTDATGHFTATLARGPHQLSVMKMTSSHSILSSDLLPVTVGVTPASLVVHVAPTAVQILVPYDAGYGNALYITGETGYLGAWTTATKLTVDTTNGTWVFQKNLQLGAQFKLLLAPWVSGTTIPVASPGVRWAAGNNDVVTPPYQYFETVLTINPTF